jgi:UPF0271 protein
MDINCDLGEGIGNDEKIMPFISSCNIACGGHVGDASTMKTTVLLAKKYGVKVGAHPSFPDWENFGRKNIQLPKQELKEALIRQINSLKEIAKNEDVTLNHIKPHGALYNLAAKNEDFANVIIEVVKSFDEKMMLYVPYKSVIAEKAKAMGITYFYEAFADRNYDDNLKLVTRDLPNAVISDTSKILKRVRKMFEEQTVLSIHNKIKKIRVDTICVHGDNPNAVEIVKTLYNFNKKSIGYL